MAATMEPAQTAAAAMMTFAERLADVAADARESWDDYVSQEVAHIRGQCEVAAKQGCSFTRVEVIPSHSDLSEEWRGTHGSAKYNYVVKRLKRACEAMGFSSATFADAGGCARYNCVVDLEWAALDHVPRKRARGNHVISCGICLERRPAVRLAPCGHMLCGGCADKSTQKCPFCRKHIIEEQDLYEP
eukprot:TRINITY_DN10242_c0_g1_i3.p1 TRINITY_DN10242_c0_g1~~TRINITY_DN10242_c0_g1_i3.p1  ORF type:complete len:205 (+),score=26.54 TRINITY_DN10242_c0_g1_i3:53-616(+)